MVIREEATVAIQVTHGSWAMVISQGGTFLVFGRGFASREMEQKENESRLTMRLQA